LLQETTATLSYRMLDEVSVPELVSACLEKTVRPYLRESDLNEEETLFSYVEVSAF